MSHKCDGCQFKGEHQEMGFRPMGVCKKRADLIEAIEFYEAEKCPFDETKSMCVFKEYCPNDCDSCEFAEDLKKSQNLNEAVKNLKTALIEAIAPICDAITQLIEGICANIPQIVSEINYVTILSYPNKKVLHLALHHPKERVRKKNMTRIRKWLEKEGEHNDL